jgi:hypothetical protein
MMAARKDYEELVVIIKTMMRFIATSGGDG